MMPSYSYRCPIHGDFAVDASMADTQPTEPCPHKFMARFETCALDAPKVLCGNLQFTYGRDTFRDGADGRGLTLNETVAEWRQAFRETNGREAELVR